MFCCPEIKYRSLKMEIFRISLYVTLESKPVHFASSTNVKTSKGNTISFWTTKYIWVEFSQPKLFTLNLIRCGADSCCSGKSAFKADWNIVQTIRYQFWKWKVKRIFLCLVEHSQILTISAHSKRLYDYYSFRHNQYFKLGKDVRYRFSQNLRMPYFHS